MTKKLAPEERERRINDKIAGSCILIGQDGDNKGRNTKYIRRCIKDGYEWSTTYRTIVDFGFGCPRCSGLERYTPDTLADRLNSVIGDKYEWSYDTFNGNETKLKLKCKHDGYEWSAVFGNIVNNGGGCPRCKGVERYTPESLANKLNDLIGDKYEWSYDTFKRRSTMLNLVCKQDGHKWTAAFHDIVNHSTGCPLCTNHGFNPNKPCDFYINVGVIDGEMFTKYGITQKAGDERLNTQKRKMVGVSEYRQVWRETFENPYDALAAERYFDSFGGINVLKENVSDGYTETIKDIPPCVIALNVIFGFHIPKQQ